MAFCETELLEYIAHRVPKDLELQLMRDAHPELVLDTYVKMPELIFPLSERRFFGVRAVDKTARLRLIWILEYVIMGYAFQVEKGLDEGDPYKNMYVAVFYLCGCVLEGTRSREYTRAILVLERAASHVDMEGKFHVCQFLTWLISVISEPNVADPTPRSTAMLALSLVVASCLSNAIAAAERSTRQEDFVQAWNNEREEFGEDAMSLHAMAMIRKRVFDTFGVSGMINQFAGRFRDLGV